MTNYYVHKGVGSDSNNGLSWANAWSSLGKAQAVAGTNATVYVRAGATPYYEQLRINKAGQSYIADTGHQPVIDGKYHDGLSDKNLSNKPAGTYVIQKMSKNDYPSLVSLSADDTMLDGFKVCNAAGRGILATKSRCIIRNCRVDWTYTSSVMINSGGGQADCTGVLVEDTEITRGSVAVYAPLDEDVWGRPYDVICAAKNTQDTTFRRVKVHHSHAEGIVAGRGTIGTIIEYCQAWNNEHMNFYINNANRPTLRFCYAFSTGHPEVLRKDAHASEPLVISEEELNATGLPAGFARDISVYGNVFVGGRWTATLARMGSNQDSQLINAYIGYNTFIGLPGVTQAVLEGGTKTTHTASVFENNVIYAPQGVGIKNRATDPMSGLKARNNVIYRPGGVGNLPNWLAQGAILADPKIQNPAAVIIDNGGVLDDPPDGGDNFSVNNYKLTGSSPAIGAAATSYPFNSHAGVALARTKDYFGATRAAPDCGFHEFGGAATDSVVAAFTRSPAATSVTTDTAVTFTDTSFTTGTATLTGRTWTVKKAGVTVATSTASPYSYTFATTGSYTVELAVTATGGLSDTETVAYTVTAAGGGVTVTAAFTAAPSQTTLPQGTTVIFTDQSTAQNSSIATRLWEVLPLPSGAAVATGSGTTFDYNFPTAGDWRVRLTATETGGIFDTETRDYTVTTVTVPTVTAAFTSSDADGVVNEGEDITFTNTSAVSGTTVSGYVWTVVRQGTTAAETYTTTDLTHLFTQAGFYDVTLRVDTAAGVSDSETVTITVQSQTTTGREVMVVPHQFTLATSTGTQTVTATALGTKVPKGVHLRFIGATTGGTAAAGALWSEGAASEGSQWVHARFSADDEGAPITRRRTSGAAVGMSIDSAGAVTGLARLLRFVPGGMELDVTDAFPAAYLAEAVFYAGDGMQFWAGSTIIGPKDTPKSVTTGIDQDAVYVSSSWALQDDTAEPHADFSRGWTTREGKQFHFRNRDFDAVSPSNLVTRFQPRVASSGDGDGGYVSIEAGNFRHDGFDLTALSSGIYRKVNMFAFRAGGYQVHLAALDVPESGELNYELPFEAQTVQALTSSYGRGALNPSGQLTGTNAAGQGWYSLSLHGPHSWSGSIAALDNHSTVTSTRSLGASGFRAVSPDGSDLWAGAAALSGSTLTVTPTTWPLNPCRMIVMAVEQAAEVVDPGDGPTADFQTSTEVDAETGRVAVWFDGTVSSGNGETIDTYAWAFGDGTTSSEARPVKVYMFDGSYVVTLTVTTINGSDTKTTTIIVLPAPPLSAPVLVGAIDPATSGGDTENAIDDETDSHTHNIRGLFARFRPMTDEEFIEFVNAEPDALGDVLMGFYPNKFVVKYSDGTICYIYPTTLPPP